MVYVDLNPIRAGLAWRHGDTWEDTWTPTFWHFLENPEKPEKPPRKTSRKTWTPTFL
jgi:hypothetical protein